MVKGLEISSFLLFLVTLRNVLGNCKLEETEELKDCFLNSTENKTLVNCNLLIKSQKEIMLLTNVTNTLLEKLVLLELNLSVLNTNETSLDENKTTSTSNPFCLGIDSVKLKKVNSAEVPNVYETQIERIYNFLLKINALEIKLTFNLSSPLGQIKSYDCNGSDLQQWRNCRATVHLSSNFFNSNVFSRDIVETEMMMLYSLVSFYLNYWRGRTEYVKIEIDDSAEENFYYVVLLNWVNSFYPLQSFSFANSKLHKTEEFRMPKLIQLQYLNLSNCRLSDYQLQFNSFFNTPGISNLDLSGNRLTTIPNSLLDLNNLRVLHLERNTVTAPFFNLSNLLEPSFKTLQELNLNALPLLQSDLRYFEELNEIKILKLQNCFLRNLPKTLTFPQSLSMIDLSFNNLITFSTENFQNSSKIETLDLSHNKLTLKEHGEELAQVKNVVHLNLSANEISLFPFKLFNHLPNLSVLELKKNKIQSWSKQFLNVSNVSRSLDLSKNRISEITKFMSQDFEYLDEVRLAGNPFDCGSCELESFQSWIQNTSVTLSDLLDYKCEFPLSMAGFPLLNATLAASCLPYIVNLWLVVALPIFILLALLFLIAGVVYRYRDHLQLLCFLFFQNFCQKEKQENSKVFDAFISYSSKDELWVKEFIDELEKNPPFYSLCLHNRNFIGGAPVQHQIIDSINSSRRLLFVLSKSFIESQWCGWELKMAQYKLFETGKSNIILIQIEQLNEQRLPKSLQHLVRTRTLLLWPNRESKRSLFYAKLRSYLGRSETAEGVRLELLAQIT